MLAVTEYQSLEEVSILEHTWNQLWSKTSGASYAQSYAAFSFMARQLETEERLNVLLVTLMGKPIGIVPLVIQPVQTSMGTLRALRFPMQEWYASFGIIGAHKTIILQAAIKFLKKNHRGWDYLDLRGYEQDGRESERVWNAGRLAEIRVFQQHDRPVSQICLRTGWENYWTRRDASLRQQIGRIENRLEALGKLKLVRSRAVAISLSRTLEQTAEELTTFQDMKTLHQQVLTSKVHGKQERRGTQLWRFIQEVHPDMVRNALADWSVLYLGEEPIAASYGLVHQGTVELISVVVSPNWPSATQQLLVKMLLEESGYRRDSNYTLTNSLAGSCEEFVTEKVPMCRMVWLPVSAWKVHAWKMVRSASHLIGKLNSPIGWYDEPWVERRRKGLSVESSIAPGATLNVLG